jgi:hypothetical protein
MTDPAGSLGETLALTRNVSDDSAYRYYACTIRKPSFAEILLLFALSRNLIAISLPDY